MSEGVRVYPPEVAAKAYLVLVETYETIFERRTWVQNAEAYDHNDISCDPRSPDAVQWCALGALIRAGDIKAWKPGYKVAEEIFGSVARDYKAALGEGLGNPEMMGMPDHIIRLNDHNSTTHPELLEQLRKAVIIAREQAQGEVK